MRPALERAADMKFDNLEREQAMLPRHWAACKYTAPLRRMAFAELLR